MVSAENIISGVNSNNYNTPGNSEASVIVDNDTLPKDGFRSFTVSNTSTNVNVGQATSNSVTNANKNKLLVKGKVDYNVGSIKAIAYYVGKITSQGKGVAENNYADFNSSSFRAVYVGRTQNGGASNFNELYATGLKVDPETENTQFRTGQITDHNTDKVNSNYNVMQILDSTINSQNTANKVFMSSGFIQVNGNGKTSMNSNTNYNSLILKNTTIYSTNSTFANGTFAGRIQKDGGDGGEASGNRVFVSGATYNANGGKHGNIIAGGFEISNSSGNEIYGKANDNIAVLTGDNALDNFYAGRITGTKKGEVKNNLVILDTTGKVDTGVYAGYGRLKEDDETWENGTGSGNAVYFIQGEVGQTIGSWGDNNTLILDGKLGDKKTGKIEKFSTLQFNVVGDESSPVLNLTSGADKSDFKDVEIKFLTADAGGSVDVVIGGKSSDDSNNKLNSARDNGGGAKAIEALTFATANGTKLYSVDDDEIYYVSGLKKEYESIKETLNEKAYSIGDTFTYTTQELDLTKPGKYYLIKSESALDNYDKVKIDLADTNTNDFNGETVGANNEIKVIATKQPDQIYHIKSANEYTRNLRGMFIENKDKDLFITGIGAMSEKWGDSEFKTDEFTKFAKASNKDNVIYVDKDAGNLGGKKIYGGESDSEDVSANEIHINQNANLSNATIIGGYSASGNVSNNIVDLNSTSVDADIILAQTDNGSIDISTNELNNADNQTITGNLTIAKSNSANLENATYTMPENITITKDFILAESTSGKISNNTLDVTNAKAANIYVGKSANGEVSDNTINIKGDKVDGNIYVGYSQSGATNNNIANFEKGEVTGTIYGGNNGTGNTLNVNDTKLKAGNVADFNIINFDNSKIASTKDSSANAALIITKNEATDLNGVRIDISKNPYDIQNNPGYTTLDKDSKYYLIHNENNKLTNYNKIANTLMPNSGKIVGNEDITVGALQTDQIYKILNEDTYTRNLAGMFVSKDEKDLYITGANEVEETWSNDKFNTDEFTKFGKPDNKDNHIFIEASAGDLAGKTIYGGYSNSEDVSNNEIHIDQNANLSNATIIGGYSASGNVSNNIVDLNNTSVDASIILAKTDSGTIKISGDELQKADGTKVKSLTVAESETSNLNQLSFTMPNLEITEDFILANSETGETSQNKLTIDKDAKAQNIYVSKSKSGNANNNLVEIGANIDTENLYVAFSESGTTNNNLAEFNSGEVTGTIHGGKGGSSDNKLNVNDIKLKAGNVADFQVLNFTGDITKTTSVSDGALILTASDNTNLSDIEIQIKGTKYNPETDYGLGSDKKYYLITHDSAENTNFTKLKNYAYGNEIKTIKDGSTAINVVQTDQNYRIIDSETYTRNLKGMFASGDKNHIYITAQNEVEEKLDKTLGDDEFKKFGKGITGNTVTIDPNKPNEELNLSSVTIGGSNSADNTLNVGKDDKRIEMDKIKVKDITNFDNIKIYIPKNPSPGQTLITLMDGSNTDLQNSSVEIFVDDLSDLNDKGGRVHVFKTANGNAMANNTPKNATVQIGTSVNMDMSDSFDLFVDKTPTPPTPTPPTPIKVYDENKIYNEARLAGLSAVWEGSYLISNHLDRIIPDAFSELFPYAIAEGYYKRYNTGSHVDAIGFNANAGLASKAPNSKGDFTLGAFVEYGISNYNAYLDNGTKGDGDTYYTGFGFFGKQENLGDSYLEGTFRVGKLRMKFDTNLSINGVNKHQNFDIDSTYYAVHAGLGKIFALSNNNDLDAYTRYFYTHIDDADIKIDGIDTHFDALKSHKVRAGLKDDFKIDENNKFYLGAAGEYEFKAKAGGRFLVSNTETGEILSPNLKGLTGIGEIGYQYKDDKVKFDAGVKGYVGKQNGASGQIAISIAF